MDEDLRKFYRTLEDRLFHEGRFLNPSFIEANNMLPTFQDIGLKSFLTLDEPNYPRFVTEFYHSLEVKRDEEERLYIKFKLGINMILLIRTSPFQEQLQRDPNRLHRDDVRLELKGWELFFRENVFCILDITIKTIKNKGKIVAPPTSSSSLSSSDENEEPSFLEFYKELSDNENLTTAQKERR
nr:hypothetical protein [Tanacetum cinerariifolium]